MQGHVLYPRSAAESLLTTDNSRAEQTLPLRSPWISLQGPCWMQTNSVQMHPFPSLLQNGNSSSHREVQYDLDWFIDVHFL